MRETSRFVEPVLREDALGCEASLGSIPKPVPSALKAPGRPLQRIERRFWLSETSTTHEP